MKIKFKHSENKHTVEGAKAALTKIFGNKVPKTVLDVGCGVGTWLKACQELGAKEVQGIDGVKIPKNQLLIDNCKFTAKDLTKPIDLKKKYALVLCLEVGEHLQENDSNTLIEGLTRHSNTILFSAACPGQKGQNHINCQWPSFWQKKFNNYGFACFDTIRKKIWDNQIIEPWYRQNIFLAKKSKKAGKEKRISPLKHPEIFPNANADNDEKIKRLKRKLKEIAYHLKHIIYAILRKENK